MRGTINLDTDKYWGVQINWDKFRYEWRPVDLEENIFQIIGTLNRGMSLKSKGTPELLEDEETWFLEFDVVV